jgi:DNA-binding NarL/FixJ family response regulator
MRDTEFDTLKVYVVDDSALLRERLVGILTELDHVEVIGEADDRDQAIIEVTKLKPQVVILDIQLRQGNGIEVLTQIKKGQPSPTVIILRNHPYPQFREKCMSTGADYFFYKATEFTKVKEVVRLLASQLHL